MRWRARAEVVANGVIAWSWLPFSAWVMWKARENLAIIMFISLWAAWRTDMGVWTGSRVRARQQEEKAEAADD